MAGRNRARRPAAFRLVVAVEERVSQTVKVRDFQSGNLCGAREVLFDYTG
jgi:hypothetical protein